MVRESGALKTMYRIVLAMSDTGGFVVAKMVGSIPVAVSQEFATWEQAEDYIKGKERVNYVGFRSSKRIKVK